MKKAINILYIIGAILLIAIVFFKEDFSDKINNGLLIAAGVQVLLIVTLEILTRRKWKKESFIGYVIIRTELWPTFFGHISYLLLLLMFLMWR